MVWMGKEPLQRPQGIASRDGMRIPPGPPPGSVSLQLLAAKGPDPIPAVRGSQAPEQTGLRQQAPKTRKDTCGQVFHALYQSKAFALCSLSRGWEGSLSP